MELGAVIKMYLDLEISFYSAGLGHVKEGGAIYRCLPEHVLGGQGLTSASLKSFLGGAGPRCQGLPVASRGGHPTQVRVRCWGTQPQTGVPTRQVVQGTQAVPGPLPSEDIYVHVYLHTHTYVPYGKSHLPRRHTWAKFSKSNIPLSGVGNFIGTASMVSMARESFQLGASGL